MGSLTAPSLFVWRTYFEEDTETPPTQNNWYTIIDEEGGVELRLVSAHYDDDEESGGTIQFRITYDGITLTGTATGGTWGVNLFMGAITHLNDNLDISEHLIIQSGTNDTAHTGYGNQGAGDPPGGNVSGSYLVAHAILVEVRTTNAPGTNPSLAYAASYAKKEAI